MQYYNLLSFAIVGIVYMAFEMCERTIEDYILWTIWLVITVIMTLLAVCTFLF